MFAMILLVLLLLLVLEAFVKLWPFLLICTVAFVVMYRAQRKNK